MRQSPPKEEAEGVPPPRPLLLRGYVPGEVVRIGVVSAASTSETTLGRPHDTSSSSRSSSGSDEHQDNPKNPPSSLFSVQGLNESAAPVFSSTLEPEPSQITDFMFLGNVNDAQNSSFLEKNNICTILNVSTEKYWATSAKVVIHNFAIPDEANFDIQQIFVDVFRLINDVRKQWAQSRRACCSMSAVGRDTTSTSSSSEPPKRLLVHCQKGKSRSATVVIAYLILMNGMAVKEALDYVTSKRPIVEPNIGFFECLRVFQNKFSNEQRTKTRQNHFITLVNVKPSLGASEVRAVFERHIGLVWDVSFYERKATGTTTSDADSGTSIPPLQSSRRLTTVFFICMENTKFASRALAQSLSPPLETPLSRSLHEVGCKLQEELAEPRYLVKVLSGPTIQTGGASLDRK